MQMLLTKEEYDDLIKKASKADYLPSRSKLQKFCTYVADNLPVASGWYKGKPWRCILSVKDDEWYCDDCPAKEICPYPSKHWSQ